MQSDFELFEECQDAFSEDHDLNPPSVVSTDANSSDTLYAKPKRTKRDADRQKEREEKREFRTKLLGTLDRLIDKL